MPVQSLPPTKKRKIDKKDSKVLQSIQDLEQQLTRALEANSSLNPLADLLDITCSCKDPQEVSKGIYALYRVLVLAIGKGKLSAAGDDTVKAVKAWLWERMNIYVDYLCGLLKDDEKILRVSAVQILFSLQKHLSSAFSSPSSPQFHNSHFRKIVNALLLCPSSSRKSSSPSNGLLDPDVFHVFFETWFSVHDDIRWFFLRDSGTLLSSSNDPRIASNLLHILEKLTTFPTEQNELNSWYTTELGVKPPKLKTSKGQEQEEQEEEEEQTKADEVDDWRKFFDEDTSAKDVNKNTGPKGRVHSLTLHQTLHSLASHKAVFTRAWLELLPRLSVANNSQATKTLVTRVLNIMHRGVLPHLTRPVLVMDWIGACVDYGGTVGLLALNALFALMKDYNLDYPSFYTRLYAFLDRNLFHLKHRARFFRMTELFLSSTHLPATLLASFVKRLSRLSLSAPPAGVIILVPFTYNILKRHPALMVMIHRTDDDPQSDPFLPDEENPLSTNALDSSLWELQTHHSHYHSGVSTLMKIFSEAFTKPGFSMEDFLDHTYTTLYDTEANRKIKKEPPLGPALEMGTAGKVSANLFKTPEAGEDGQDVVNDLWSFGP